MSLLFYDKPAYYDWNQALPIGNGRLGGMIYGNTDFEHIMLNEDTLWYGGPLDRINQDARENLTKVRGLILDGHIKEAEDLLLHAFSGNPASQRPYAPLGEIYINYLDIKGECTEYRRELDLESAIHRVFKTYNGVKYIEYAFASAVENTIVVHIETADGSAFNVDVDAGRMCFVDKTFHDDTNTYFKGEMVGDNYSYCGGLTAFAASGNVTPTGQYLLCREVTSLTIIFSAATSYHQEDPFQYVKDRLNYVRSFVSYKKLKEEHITDYKKYFDACRLTLKYDGTLDTIPTDKRLENFDEEHPDNGLVQTYFDFGRYLLISCSRPGTMPANLQGIWCKDFDPAWGCKYTININTQMNYWPAEMFNLSDMHMPLFDHMKRMQPNGQKTAKEMYGCRGFVCHHNTDLWGDTAPQDLWIPGTYWVMSVPWLCTHIMQHYDYTMDIDFLKDMYPVIKDSVLFFHDFLIIVDNKALICPSVSPENTYILPSGEKGSICASSTMDNAILRDLFELFIKAYSLVEDDDEDFLAKTKELLSMLPEIKIGKHGQVMEWLEDYDELEPGHRHISQLYALHPSHQIEYGRDDEFIDAARATIDRRLANGGGHTGWSRAWIMNMFARLRDNKKCYENLVALLKKSTLTNLFDNHPPFQIDGNFGSIAAIGEMLCYVNDNNVVLLPALPDEFADGSIKNMKIPGDGLLSMTWAEGKLKVFSVKAKNHPYHGLISYKEKKFKLDMAPGEEAHFEIY